MGDQIAASVPPAHESTALDPEVADICVSVSLEHQADPLGRAAVARAFTDEFLADLDAARAGGHEALARLYAATVRSRVWWNRASALTAAALVVVAWVSWQESPWVLVSVAPLIAVGLWTSMWALSKVVRRKAIDLAVVRGFAGRNVDAGVP